MHIIRLHRIGTVRFWNLFLTILATVLLTATGFAVPASAQVGSDSAYFLPRISSSSAVLPSITLPFERYCIDESLQTTATDSGSQATVFGPAIPFASIASNSEQYTADFYPLLLHTINPALTYEVMPDELIICQPYRLPALSNVIPESEAATASAVLGMSVEATEEETGVEYDPTIKVLMVAATAAPKPSAAAAPAVVGSAEVLALIDTYAAQYGVSAEIMKKIAQCESGMRANASNGSYGGMFQFIAATWSSNRRAMGLDPDPALRYHAEEAIRTAAFKMSRDGYGAWPACSRQAMAS